MYTKTGRLLVFALRLTKENRMRSLRMATILSEFCTLVRFTGSARSRPVERSVVEGTPRATRVERL